MRVYVDIDGTICTQAAGLDYAAAEPLADRIAAINRYYELGHTVIYWTARGTETGIDWRSVTEAQLARWEVKYHTLLFGKPAFDLFIDDRAWNPLNGIPAPSPAT
jgi:dTDP-glucose 4,6-dehydratase